MALRFPEAEYVRLSKKVAPFFLVCGACVHVCIYMYLCVCEMYMCYVCIYVVCVCVACRICVLSFVF